MKVDNDMAEVFSTRERRTHGPWSDLALHTIGWRAFQDLCSQVCEVVLSRSVEIFREAQDGGQDAVFLIPSGADAPAIGNLGSELMVGHKVGFITDGENPSDGLRRRDTDNASPVLDLPVRTRASLLS